MTPTWNWDALGVWLTEQLGATQLSIANLRQLSGGAVNRNIAFDAMVDGGGHAGRHVWVMRTGVAMPGPSGIGRAAEFAVMAAAHRLGAQVPKPIAACNDATSSPTGLPFIVIGHCAGIGEGRRIVRDPDLGVFGPGLAAELGHNLALIHGIRPPNAEIVGLGLPTDDAAKAEIARLHAGLDKTTEPRPALEYILCWLDAHAPPPRASVLVHGDFRTGNYLVDGGRLSAILDWELAHWGDPREDIGWFAARCWRFGNDAKVAGGIAKFAAFLDAYNAQIIATHGTDAKITAAEIVYWEIFAAARWAAFALIQGARATKASPDRALELALTGLMAPEMEYDALVGIEAFGKDRRP